MFTTTMIRIEEHEIRGYWLTATSQRVESWVPPGEYEHGGAATVRGELTIALIARSSERKGWAYHVSAAALQKLKDSRIPAGWDHV